MNANTQTEPAPTAAEIAQRILGERVRLNAEQRLELELKEQRKIPLEAGDDKVVDSLDGKIERCLQRQIRIEERLEVLQTRQAEATEAEQQIADLAIVEEAQALRAEGIKLIEVEFPKVAKPLVALFEKMQTIDSQIAALNSQLHDDSKAVSYPNSIRTTPEYWTETTIPHGSCTIDSPLHPRHGAPTYFDPFKGTLFTDTREPVRNHPLTRTVRQHHAAVPQPSIPESVNLPGIWPAKEST